MPLPPIVPHAHGRVVSVAQVAKATEEVWAEAEAWVDAEARAEEAAWARLQTTLKATTGDDGDVSQDNIELLLTQVGRRRDAEGGRGTRSALPYG